jgi:plasmid stabilization system protein ParE
MASSKSALVVSLAPAANDDLWEIWGDNAERYGLEHADSYLDFLRTGINRLSSNYDKGWPVEGFAEFKLVTLKRSRRGQGHYIIFKVDEAEGLVKVLRVYHTRMDVKSRLNAEFR